MEAIKNTVENVIRSLVQKKKTLADLEPSLLLKKTLTRKELEHIKFNYFKKGILSLNVDSSVWKYKLSLQKKDLLDKLSNLSTGIKDIRFYIGEIK